MPDNDFETLSSSDFENAGNDFETLSSSDFEVDKPKPTLSLQQLGHHTKPDFPGYNFTRSGVTHRESDNRYWLPSTGQWHGTNEEGGVELAHGKPNDAEELRDAQALAQNYGLTKPDTQAQTGLPTEDSLRRFMKYGKSPVPGASPAKFMPAESAPPAPSQDWGENDFETMSPLKGVNRPARTTEINPYITPSTTDADVQGTGINLPQGGLDKNPMQDVALAAHRTLDRAELSTARSFEGAKAYLYDMFKNVEGEDEYGNHYSLSGDDMARAEERWQMWMDRAKDYGQQLQEFAPKTEAGKIMAEVSDILPTVAKFAITGPGAPLVMGLEMAGNKYLDAVESGKATREQAQLAASIDGAVGTIIGLLPGGTKAKEMTSYALQKLGRGFVLGVAMHGANAGSEFIYNPEEAKKQLRDPVGYLRSVLTIMAYESIGIGHEMDDVKSNKSRSLEQKPGEHGSPVATEPAPTRSRADIIKDIAESAGNDERLKSLHEELRNSQELTPEVAPAGISPEGEVAPKPKPESKPENKGDRRGDLDYGMNEQESRIEDLRVRHQEATDRLANVQADLASPNKGRNRRGQRDYDMVLKNVLDLSRQLEELTGSTPAALNDADLISGDSSEFAKKWRQIRQEQKNRLNEQTGLGKTNDFTNVLQYIVNEGFHATKDIGRLVGAAIRDGARSAAEFMERMKNSMHPEDWKGLLEHWGGEEGVRKLWDEHKTLPVDIHDSTSYQGERHGPLMGPNDEMIVARNPSTGKDVGKLWVTKEDGGYTVRKIETDENFRRRGIAEQLGAEANKRWGKYLGATDYTPEGEAFRKGVAKKTGAPDVWDIGSLEQEHPSAATSINANRLPTTAKAMDLKPGTVNADIGGGRFENFKKFLESHGITSHIIDPFNRKPDYNQKSIDAVRGGQADTATVNNVLNVIKEAENRQRVIAQAADAIKPGGTAYFKIHEGDRDGNSRQTRSNEGDTSWQEHRKADTYIDEIKQHFGTVERKGDILIAKDPIRGGAQEVAAGANPFKIIRDMAQAAKKELGLPDGATDRELAEAIMGKIGSLGKTVGETALKIAGQVKGMSREAAKVIAEHLHAESEKASAPAAIDKKLNAEMYPDAFAEHKKWSDEQRAWIKANVQDPEQRKALYNSIPRFKPPVAPSPTLAAPGRPEQKFNRGGHGKGILQGITDLLTDTSKQAGTEDNLIRLHGLAEEAGILQKKYKDGSGEAPVAANSSINPSQPKVLSDFAKGESPGGIQQTLRSPHNIWQRVFGSNNPAVDALLGGFHKAKMGREYGRFMTDVMKGVDDASVAVKERMQPLFEQFRRDQAKLESAKKAHAEDVASGMDAEEAARKHKPAIDQANANMDAVMKQKSDAIKGLAEKHADVRIAIAAESKKGEYPDWLKLSPDEEKKADSIRDFTGKMKEALDKVGIKTLGDDDVYVTHMAHYLTGDTGKASRDTVKSALNFRHRESDTGQWLPSAHAFGDTYIPSVAHKLAFQPFLNKWGTDGGMLDPKNESGLTHPTSENNAPGAAKYLTDIIHTMQNPAPRTGFDKATDAMRDASNTLLLGFNPRVGYKHLVGKATSIAGEHHVWIPNATKNQVQGFIGRIAEQHPKFQSLLERTGLNKDGNWQKKAELVSHFVIPREILNAMKDDPFVAEVSGRKAPRNEVTKTAVSLYRTVRDNPVQAVETWENGLNVMASLARARGMDWGKAQEAVMSNLLDFNFRGGADSPGIIRNRAARAGVQFAQTPMKSTELKGKLIINGLRGGEDIFGTSHTAKLIRQIMAYGSVGLAAGKLGINVADSLAHIGLINPDMQHHIVVGAKSSATGDWDDVKDRAAAMYGIQKEAGLFPNAPWLNVPFTMFNMGAKAYLADGGVKEKAAAAMNELPAYRQVAPALGLADVPKPYDDVTLSPEDMKGLSEEQIRKKELALQNIHNLTGTAPEDTRESRDRMQIKKGWKEWKKLSKKANQ